MSSFSNTVGSL